MIELLVVISIIALLMAILLPCLQRARKQANTVACQANLRQWGVFINLDTAENGGQFEPDGKKFLSGYVGPNPSAGVDLRGYNRWQRNLSLCPAASRLEKNNIVVTSQGHRAGSGTTYTASWLERDDGRIEVFSYGFNDALRLPMRPDRPLARWWESPDRRGAPLARVPIMCDSIHGSAVVYRADSKKGPPPYEDLPYDLSYGGWQSLCVSRHEGSMNYLFLDWSVRKVGLKELWTLKWCEGFDTAGPWTKAGGVQPEDWPEWMRRFKEY